MKAWIFQDPRLVKKRGEAVASWYVGLLFLTAAGVLVLVGLLAGLFLLLSDKKDTRAGPPPDAPNRPEG